MKRLLIVIIFILIFPGIALSTTSLYRISSNEVVATSLTDDPFTDSINVYHAVISNASYPDGTQCMDSKFDLRILGIAKILDGTVVRNATQVEIDSFGLAATEDGLIEEAAAAIRYFDNDPKFRRIMIAFAAILISEINILRSQHGLADRTLGQLKTAIRNRISKDD